MARLPARLRALIGCVAFTLALASCSGRSAGPSPGDGAPRANPSPRVSAGGGVDRARIRIVICPRCLRSARAVGAHLRRVARATADRVGELFPDLSTVVRIRVDPEASIPEVGVGGFTDLTTGVVTISLDPTFVDYRTTLHVWLPVTVAHELDHAERTLHGPGYGTTLLDAMVSEGMADAFARQALPDASAIPWDRALNRVEEDLVWRLARPRLGERQDSAAHALWFYGSGRLPRWAGYTIGRDIVRSYLRRHPNQDPAGIVRLSARRILAASRFAR